MTRHPVHYGVALFLVAYSVVIWYFQGVHRRALAAKAASSSLANSDPITTSKRGSIQIDDRWAGNPFVEDGSRLVPGKPMLRTGEGRADSPLLYQSPIILDSPSSEEIEAAVRPSRSSISSTAINAPNVVEDVIDEPMEEPAPQGLRPLEAIAKEEEGAGLASDGLGEDAQGLRPLAEFSTLGEEGAGQEEALHKQVSDQAPTNLEYWN